MHGTIMSGGIKNSTIEITNI